MRKQFMFVLVATFLIGMITSCEEIDNPAPLPTNYLKSYIDMFIECDSLDIWSFGGMAIDDENKRYDIVDNGSSPEGIGISVNATYPAKDYWSSYPTNIYYPVLLFESPNHLQINDDNPYYRHIQIQYDKYIEEVGDTTYNRMIGGRYGNKKGVVITVFPLKEVVITADKSFGSDYPAGTDLSSLFRIIFDDVYATVHNGYMAAPGTYRYIATYYSDEYFVNSPMSIRCLKLSEINLEDYPFTEARWDFFLEAKPEKTDTYTFHVKLTFTDGTVLEGDSRRGAIMVKGRD
ncbi:hypothetical protein [Bacteroides sp. UBA939]|uniref:hypothetical protein n=1 Tax=Bacteroides sp. UBA939 TaxID=1946092 RepID=UPI0025C058B5|nr:hypothetical protein [Bacteroides sp. UBA939]